MLPERDSYDQSTSVLLLPGDIFARRNVAPVLQQLESAYTQDFSVNDVFKPVSRYWDRINRPDQLPSALMEAMRVLVSPAETGAVTLALPQDVQAEAWDYSAELFEKRIWHIQRPMADRALFARAVEWIRAAKKPFIITGGACLQRACEALARLVEQTGFPPERRWRQGALPGTIRKPGSRGRDRNFGCQHPRARSGPGDRRRHAPQ